MHVVIVGANRVGVSLARWLVSAGHEIVVIDRDRNRCNVLDQSLGSVSVFGDGTDNGTLAKAGANRADVFVATTRRDDVNLVSCQLARHRFGISRTIAVVNDSEYTELFGMLGIDVSVDLTELMVGRIQEGLSAHGLVHLKAMAGLDGRRLVYARIPPESGVIGRSVKEIALPNGTLISLIISRDGDTSVPAEDTVLRGGDEVVAVTSAQDEGELRQVLIEETEE